MTLTETATITKRFLRVFLIFGTAFLVLWITFLYVYNNIIIPYQKSQIKPEKRFGPLAKPSFPPSIISSASLTYSLDTKSGGLPTDIPRLVNVYFLPPSETTLLSPDRARQLATTLGFGLGPDILSPTQYRFHDTNSGTLVIDLSTNNFSYKRSVVAPPDALQDEVLPEAPTITLAFKNYLENKGLLKSGFTAANITVIYDKGNNKDSNTATVSLWPDPVGRIPVVTGNPLVGLVHSTVTKYQAEQWRYQDLQYTYWPVDSQTLSTYSLEPISQAFAQLQQGLGIVVRNDSQGTKASISRIYLAYYMSQSYSSFLHPVYVFESDSFTAYIPALTADSYTQ